MKAILFGVQRVDFKPNDNEEIRGVKLHYGFVPSATSTGSENIAGFKYESTFVRPDFKGKLFGFSANDIFANFGSFKSSFKFPAEVNLNFELEGRKAVFSGADLVKKDDKE